MGNLLSRAEITEADINSAAETLLPWEGLCPGTGEKNVNISRTSDLGGDACFCWKQYGPWEDTPTKWGGWTLTKGHLEILFTNEGRMD